MCYDLKETTNTHVTPIFKAYTDIIYDVEDLFCILFSYPSMGIFLPVQNGFYLSNDGSRVSTQSYDQYVKHCVDVLPNIGAWKLIILNTFLYLELALTYITYFSKVLLFTG